MEIINKLKKLWCILFHRRSYVHFHSGLPPINRWGSWYRVNCYKCDCFYEIICKSSNPKNIGRFSSSSMLYDPYPFLKVKTVMLSQWSVKK